MLARILRDYMLEQGAWNGVFTRGRGVFGGYEEVSRLCYRLLCRRKEMSLGGPKILLG